MPDLSPFQTLPLHIAEEIGYYCVGLQRHRHRLPFRKDRVTKNVWLVLYGVSHYWRQLALKNLNKSVALRLSKNPKDDRFTTTLCSRRVTEQSSSIIPHVKEVHVCLEDIVEEPNEESLEKLSRAWPEDLVFPKARSLTCSLEDGYTQASNSARKARYFKWFVERVRSSFPNLQETTIEFELDGKMSISPGILFSKEWDASLFLSALFRFGRWVGVEIPSPIYVDNEHALIKNAPELTSFRYSKSISNVCASWIIRKSAATLEKLHYGKIGGGRFKAFMFNDDGQVIVYPRLRDLHVFDSSYGKGELTTDKSIIPFPVLQRLRVNSGCVFKDDTIFRRSSDTMVSLDIGLHGGFVDIFQKHKVFLQGAYPNILHITAKQDNRHGLALQNDEFTEAAFGLVSSGTQSIKLVGDISYQHITSAIMTCTHLENIQILLLEKAELSVLEILDVLKSIPRVTDFGCRFQGTDSELTDIQDKLIPSHLGTQFSRLISRLKCWHMYYPGSASAKEIAVLFVTLAVLCPNFTFVRGSAYDNKASGREIECIISSGLYDEHTERLGSLFCSS